MRKEVIQILSDNEQCETIKDKEYRLLQKQIQDEAAIFKSPIRLILAVNSQFIPGTIKEKNQVMVERIKKMYIDKLKFDGSKGFACLKRQPNYNEANSQLVLTQIMIYGSEFWPTRQIAREAQKLQLKLEPIKIDDSHSILRFQTYNDAKKWLQFYVKDKSVLATKMEQEQDQSNQQDIISADSSMKIKGWFELEPYQYQGFCRLRQARFCTSSQKNIEQLMKNIKTTNFAEFKQYVEKQLLKSQQEIIAFKKAEERNFHTQKRYPKLKYNRHQRQDHYNDQFHNQQAHGKRSKSYREDRSRHKHKQKKSHREYGQQRNNEYWRQNRTMQQNSPLANISRTNQTSIINEGRDDASSYSFILDNSMENPDVSIANELNQMTIEEGQLNLSIDLTPIQQSLNPKDDLNMSVVISKQNKDKNTGNKQQQKPSIEEEGKKINKDFDYDKYVNYVQDSLIEEQKNKVKQFKPRQ